MERTFAIIKPDAFAAGNAGKILARIYAEGFKVVGIKKLYMSKVEAEGFIHSLVKHGVSICGKGIA